MTAQFPEIVNSVHSFFPVFTKFIYLVCLLFVVSSQDMFAKRQQTIVEDMLLQYFGIRFVSTIKRCVECLRNCCLPNFQYIIDWKKTVRLQILSESKALRLENEISGSFV